MKISFLTGFSLATIGGLIVIFYGLEHQDAAIFPVLILFAKYGISLSFQVVFLANDVIFPILFAATAIGYCNFFARLFSALSPLFANLEEPAPMIMFTACAAVTAIAVQFLRVPKSGPTRTKSVLAQSE